MKALILITVLALAALTVPAIELPHGLVPKEAKVEVILAGGLLK